MSWKNDKEIQIWFNMESHWLTVIYICCDFYIFGHGIVIYVVERCLSAVLMNANIYIV